MPCKPTRNITPLLPAGERGVHAERQHDGEDHRLWHGQGARTRRSSQGALRDPRVCRSGGNFHFLFSLNSDTFCPEHYQKDQSQF